MNTSVGRLGEKVAVRYLRRKGLTIKETNYRCPVGEVDIVAEEGEWLVFVEVKARRSVKFGLPQYSVTRYKLERLRRVAQYYLASHRIKERPVRFDCVAILLDSRSLKPQHIEHIPFIR